MLHMNGVELDLANAVVRANRQNYLGSPETVDYLLRDFARRAIHRVDPEDKTHQWAHADIADCVELANIFLGKDQNFATIPNWNRPGRIDEFAKERMNLQGDSQQIMGAVFREYLKDVYRLYQYAIDGAAPESWEFQVDALVHEYTNILLGVRESENS